LDRYLRVGTVSGFNLEAFNEFSPVALFPGDVGVAVDACSEPLELFDFNFACGRRFPGERKHLAATVVRDGRCQGVLQWISLALFGDIVLENELRQGGSDAGKGHWKPVLHTFAEPLDLRAGQKVHLSVTHNRKNLAIYAEAVTD
jgi:type II protein arginine methyltransferase